MTMEKKTRGVEKLRKLAADIGPDWDDGNGLFCALKDGTEGDWGAEYRSGRLLRDVLDEIADEIEQGEQPAPMRERAADATGKSAEGCGSLREWLDRWFIERPLFEGGEPVQFGDEFAGRNGEPDTVKAVVIWDDRRCDLGGEESGWNYNAGERVKRPKRDSMEKIEQDALRLCDEYWGCAGSSCEECPAKVGGKRPFERYETDKERTAAGRCNAAQRLDLLRRQREVLEREHGRA